MSKYSIEIIALALIVLVVVSCPSYAVDGWASVEALGITTTTGGAAGNTVMVSDEPNLVYYAGHASPYVIRVQGTILLTARLQVNSNKTLIGVDTSSTINGMVAVDGKSNVIIRYLNITNLHGAGGTDGLQLINSAHHIWVDHCTIYDCADGCLDTTRAADYITVSWCKFYYTADWGHNLVCLISSSDTDEGNYRITWHHNWWSTLCKQRMPNVKHGYSHIYNCYWNCTGNGYCTDVRLTSQCLSEHNWYQSVNSPLEKKSTGTPRLKTVNVVFNNCTGYQHTGNDTLDPILYSYTLDPVADVPALVTAGAGNTAQSSDVTPPSPSPMTWATEPYGANSTSIAMVATTATDASGVEYYFDCTSGGGHDSAWQDSTSYTDTGLITGITYSYQVKARDKSSSHNETGLSAVASASPTSDTTAPTPNPMTWAVVPNATGIDTITMTASTATDASGVEYFFANITDPNYDSGWQDSTVYTDTGLTNNMTYAYRVRARDKSTGQNETGWSEEAIATTIRFTCSGAIATDFNTDCKVDFSDYATLANVWGTAPGAPAELIINGVFDTDIASWTVVAVSGATGTMTAVFDGAVGNPAGSAFVAADNTVATNNHRFYQVFAVTVGKSYTLSGEWSGSIVGFVTDPTGGALRNWAEIFVGFETSTTPSSWTSTGIMYKKAYGAGLQNTTTGIWNWEPFTSSPNGSAPPAGGIFTATAPYMVVAFNLGGRVGSGSPYIHADNISVIETGGTPCPTIDLNGDCAFDWLDIQVFAADWLACNRNPGSECLQQ